MRSQREGIEGSEEQRKKRRKCDFYMNLIMMFLILTDAQPECGSAIKSWLIVYFCIQLMQLLQGYLWDKYNAA